MSTVLVFGPQGEPLNPCHPARARQLLRQQRAEVASKRPYAIRLVNPAAKGITTEPVEPLHPEFHDEG